MWDISKRCLILYRSEGKWIVRSRGIVAIIFIVLILGLALNSLVIDPIYETNAEVPVKISMSRGNPGILLEGFDVNVIVVRPIITESLPVTPNSCRDSIMKDCRSSCPLTFHMQLKSQRQRKVGIAMIPFSLSSYHWHPSECVPTPSTKYEHEPINEFHSPLHFTNFLCDRPSEIAVSVNSTKMNQFFPIIDNRGSFQVMIGHSNDTLTTKYSFVARNCQWSSCPEWVFSDSPTSTNCDNLGTRVFQHSNYMRYVLAVVFLSVQKVLIS